MTWDLMFLHKIWSCCPERSAKFGVKICIMNPGSWGVSPPTNAARVNALQTHIFSYIWVNAELEVSQNGFSATGLNPVLVCVTDVTGHVTT